MVTRSGGHAMAERSADLGKPILVYRNRRRAVGHMMSRRRLAAGKPFDGLVLIIIIEMFDLRFHEMTCNARYYPKKSAI